MLASVTDNYPEINRYLNILHAQRMAGESCSEALKHNLTALRDQMASAGETLPADLKTEACYALAIHNPHSPDDANRFLAAITPATPAWMITTAYAYGRLATQTDHDQHPDDASKPVAVLQQRMEDVVKEALATGHWIANKPPCEFMGQLAEDARKMKVPISAGKLKSFEDSVPPPPSANDWWKDNMNDLSAFVRQIFGPKSQSNSPR